MSSSASDDSSAAAPAGFPPTLWTVVLEAAKGTTGESLEALGKLCAAYRQPVVNWLKRRGTNPADAEDLAQGFLAYLLEKNRLEYFVRGDAKFRSFLLKCLKGFLNDERRKAAALKRGGGEAPLSLDEIEVGAPTDVDRPLDRDFALAVHHRALRVLGEKSARSGQSHRFETLRHFVLGTDASVSYSDIARDLEMTAGAVKKAVFDLREGYCDVFRSEVAQIVSREDIDAEMRYLVTLLADTEATA